MTLAERVLDRPEYQPFDATVEPRTMRRVSLRLLPLLFVCYVAAYLDRANVSFAALQMNRELHFSAAVYGFGASVFYVGYAVLEVPSNLVLARIGARRWIARIMITWGVVAAAMMFVRTPLSFYVLRFLLGVAEAGFFPGVVYYLSEWFPANRRARAVSRFMLGIPIAGIVSGLVSGPLLGLEGRWSLAGWQWLFVIEALPSVVLGFVVLAMLTDRPADARWLADDERAWLVQRIEVERAACPSHGRVSFVRALNSARVWRLGLIWAGYYLAAIAYSSWAPQLIKPLFGWSAARVGVVVALISAATMITIVLNGMHSDRSGERRAHVAVPMLITAAAWLTIAAHLSPVITFVALAGTAVASNAIYGPFWCLPAAMLTGEAAAAGFALINAIGSVGAFLGPNIVGVARQWTSDGRAGFLLLACIAFASGISVLCLERGSRAIALR
jgi:ACS family tartrate transporter-like MFS transporter